MHILFVCSGNISRSFAAEMLLENEIERLHLDSISVSSAGLSALPGSPPEPKMVEHLFKMDVAVKSHQARQLTKEDVHSADLVLVMEKDHARTIRQRWPEAKDKVELLGKFLSQGQFEDEIADPFGRSSYHYR